MTRVGLATPLSEATDAGLRAVADGGNAIDAALTAAAVLTVAYPHNNAIGGDLLALVREPNGVTTFINASGRAPKAVNVDEIRRTYDQMPLTGPHTVTVPGLVSGWAALHGKGAAHSWERVLEPAIMAAVDGVAVSRGLAETLTEDWSAFSKDPGLRDVFGNEGEPLALGQTLRQPALGRTLSTLASEGADSLYMGDLGERLVEGLRALGVPLIRDDLREHSVTEQPPLQISIRDWRVFAARPNSQGFVLLRLLGMLSRADGDAAPLHERVPATVLATAFQATAAERDRILADPDFMESDVEQLLTDSALDALLASSRGAVENTPSRTRQRPDGDTVAVVAADSEGRSVSLIQSLYYSFGSQILEPTTGVVMHNRGSCFSLDPNSPNVIGPGKRPLHTLLPALAERYDERLVVGTMGGEVQPQILTQVLSRLMAGQSPQQSVTAPRWTVGPWDRGAPSDSLNWEGDVDPSVIGQFEDWAGPLNELPSRASEVGHAQAVRVKGTDIESGTDPRADATAT